MGSTDNTAREIEDAVAEVEADVRHEVAGLRGRARSLRHQAEVLDDVLAVTYRRRASELEMEAWILGVQYGIAEEPADTTAA